MAGLGNVLKRPFSTQRVKDAGISGINPFHGKKMLKEDYGDLFKERIEPADPGGPKVTQLSEDETTAGKRRRAAQSRGGRGSTVLSDDEDRFGG